LSKQPDDRYPDMEALAADLQRYQAGHEPEAVAHMAAQAEGAALQDQVPDKPKRSPWLKFVAVGAVVMGATLGTVLILIGSPPPQPDPAAASTQSTPPPAPMKTVVLVDAEPRTAVAAYEGKSLSFPTNLEIEAGKPVTLEVKADGYASQTVTLDGSEKKRFVKLVALAVTAPATTEAPATSKPIGTRPSGTVAVPTTTKSTNTGGGGEVVDPWGGGGATKPPPNKTKKPNGK
jgi:serine/threonine-protein kinase